MALALGFSAAELSKRSWLVWPVATLTTLIRGLPELLVVLFIYFGSTQVLFLITGEYVEFSPFACGVLALSLLFASYATQTLRAALNAVPAGQRLAALALGLGKSHIFFASCCPGLASRLAGARQPVAGVAERHCPGFPHRGERDDAPGSDGFGQHL